VALARVDAFARALAGKQADQDSLTTAAEIAEASWSCRESALHARALIAKIFAETDMEELRRLLALDRYERYAHTKRRRASVKLADVSAAE
jgi:hypothetical protein